MHEIAKSANYAILADHDYVYLRQGEQEKRLGWMYGNAQAAYIDYHENWAVVVGCGLWVVHLPLRSGKNVDSAPNISTEDTFSGNAKRVISSAYLVRKTPTPLIDMTGNPPVICLMNNPNGAMWFETVYCTGEEENIVRLVSVLADENTRGVYDFNVHSLEINKRL